MMVNRTTLRSSERLCLLALAVIDSSGKLPSGMIAGTAASLGHFDQCLDIVVGESFRGKFCNLELWLRDLPRPSRAAADVLSDEDSVSQSLSVTGVRRLFC